MKPIAVIILNWNGEQLLRRYLPSVVEHTPRRIADVIVVDNGSTDGSVAVMESEFPQVELIRFDHNYGFAEGYNRAIELTDYTYTVLLNSDVAVTEDWLTPLYDYMVAHPQVAAVQPKILSERRPGYFEYAGASGGFLDCHGYPYCRGRIFDTIEHDRGQYDTPLKIFWASGACLMVESEAYRRAGGLDSAFFAHMEEIDLCWRLQMMGREVAVVPAARVYHRGGASLDASNPRKTYLNFRNNLLMLYKNLPPGFSRMRLLFVRRLIDTLAFLRFVATLKWGHAWAVVKAHLHYLTYRRRIGRPPVRPIINLIHATPEGRRDILVDYYLKRRGRFSEL